MDFDTIEKIRKKYPARLARARAIKLYCKECCCCGELESWKNCSLKACFLWNFRTGKETLGNTTSFKKQRQNRGLFAKKEPSTDTLSQEEVKHEDYNIRNTSRSNR